MTAAPPSLDRRQAEALDAADPLAALRERFVFARQGPLYLDGNSLGRLPRATAERLERVVRDGWGEGLISSWDEWIGWPVRVGDRLAAAVLGARPGEVAVADSTTVNFYRLAVAALDGRRERRTIVTDRANFPTDRYVLEGLARDRGLEIRWLDTDPVAGPQPEEVAGVLDGDVALVTLSHVNYRSAAIADLPAITALAHDAGALTLWDLSHSGGSVPVELEAAGADLAVGCTYKYLNGGPGAPAYLYVRGTLQERLRNPVQGWFGQREQFLMGPHYEPRPGIGAWLAGTPSVLGLAAVEEGVSLIEEAGLAAIRAKGIALTELAITLLDAWLGPLGGALGSPRAAADRGAHVAVRHPAAERLCRELIAQGVIPDFRQPDSIRMGLSPLTTRFVDVWDGFERLRALLA
jgi:kynureninase